MMTEPVITRPARPDDVTAVLGLVRELAEYEHASDQVRASVDDLSAALFGPFGSEGAAGGPRVSALVAESDGRVVGIAVYFVSFSTWTGRHGIYLEDLYVTPAERRRGVGRALLARLAAEAVANGWSRLEWSVLDWNTPAIEFYRACGAQALSEWTTFRVCGESLQALAGC